MTFAIILPFFSLKTVFFVLYGELFSRGAAWAVMKIGAWPFDHAPKCGV